MKLLNWAVVAFVSGFIIGIYLPRAETTPVTASLVAPETFSVTLNETLDVHGPFVETVWSPPRTTAGRFISAMRFAGYTNELTNVDLGRAWELLNELAAQDWDNAAYKYYRLAVEAKLGFTSEQLERTAFQILKSETFRDPVTSIYSEIERRSMRNRELGTRLTLEALPHVNETAVLESAAAALAAAPSVRKHLALLMGGQLNPNAAGVLGKSAAQEVAAMGLAKRYCVSPSAKLSRDVANY